MILKTLTENEEGFGIIIDNCDYLSKENNAKYLKESFEIKQDSFEPLIVYATLQKYDVENRNGRIYPKDILMREVEKYREVIKRNSSFHELDHPEQSIISLKGGSPHRILDMFWEGNALIGKLEILISEGYRKYGVISCDGDMVAHYLRYGQTLGISSRGVGSLKKVNGKNVVQDDFELVAWDIVSSPSTPGSYIYKNKEDFNKYNEILGNEEEPTTKIYTSDNKTTNEKNNLINRLNSFLGNK